MIGGVPGGWGGFFWGLLSRSKTQSGTQSSSFTAGRLFRQEEWYGAKTDGNTPSALNPVADLTYPGWVSGINVVLLLGDKLRAHSFFVQQTSLLAPCWVPHEREGSAQPGDRISPPAETGNKSNPLTGCFSSWQVVRKTYFTEKIRPLNSRRGEPSQPSFTLSIPPPVTLCIFVSDFQKILLNCKVFQTSERILSDRNMETPERWLWGSSLNRGSCVSVCFAWPFGPRCELGTKSSRNQPQQNKVLRRTDFKGNLLNLLIMEHTGN